MGTTKHPKRKHNVDKPTPKIKRKPRDILHAI